MYPCMGLTSGIKEAYFYNQVMRDYGCHGESQCGQLPK